MPRCPLCASARITILVSLHPHAFCASCGTRWIQDGREQRAIKTGPKGRLARAWPDRHWPALATTPAPASFYQATPRRLPGDRQP